METEDPDGFALLLFALLGLILFGLYVWSVIWAYQDAKLRNQYPVLVAIMVVFLAWPLGVIIWLLIRRKAIV